LQTFEKVNSSYAKIKEQLKEDKFCKREEIAQLNMTLTNVLLNLASVNQNLVGKEEFDKQTNAVKKLKDDFRSLKQEFNSQLKSYFVKQALKAEQLLAIDDYTQSAAQEKMKAASEALQAAQEKYDDAKELPEFTALQERISSQAARLQSLQEKTALYSALANQAISGTKEEKAAANTSLLKLYIGFGRLAEAEKCLEAIPNRAGLESYVNILNLEKKLINPSQGPAMKGLPDEIAKSYTALVSAYKKDSKVADRLKLYLAMVTDKTGTDMSTVQKELSEVQDLEDTVEELKQKARTQNGSVKKELEEQTKALEQRRKIIYATLDGYVTTGDSKQAKQELKIQLQNAYKAAGYDSQASKVPERFK